MAVFRIERTRDYTVMSNHHLRNHELSLKAKGLLSMMLSLPDDWNYTTRGLAKICKEGVDAIGNALRELETAGYIVRHQLRDRQGRISDTEYSSAHKGAAYKEVHIYGIFQQRSNRSSDPRHRTGCRSRYLGSHQPAGRLRQRQPWC